MSDEKTETREPIDTAAMRARADEMTGGPDPHCDRCGGNGAEYVGPGPDTYDVGSVPCSCIRQPRYALNPSTVRAWADETDRLRAEVEALRKVRDAAVDVVEKPSNRQNWYSEWNVLKDAPRRPDGEAVTRAEREEVRRALRHQDGWCRGPYERVPAPGQVDLKIEAQCPECGRVVRVTVRGRYAHHKRVVGGAS